MPIPGCDSVLWAVRKKLRLKREFLWGMLFILPSLTGCLVFVIIPFFGAIISSVTNAFTGTFAGFAHYVSVFNNTSFQTASVNTLRFIGLCVPILIVISLALATMLFKPVFIKSSLRAAFLLPMAIPAASVALLWQVLFHSNGLVNGLMKTLSLQPVEWMRTDYALLCLIIAYVWKNAGYNMVLFLAGLSSIAPELYEAASVDGAGEWRKFISITWPGLRPTLFTVTVLSTLNTFKAYREAWLVAGNYPHTSIYLVQHTLNNWFTQLEIEKISAAATVMAMIILVLVAILNRTWGLKNEETLT